MGRIPENLKQLIGKNLRAYRMRRFPGYGGSKKCAEALGVSQQQWSTWESGRRMPDEVRLAGIAAFFQIRVEELRQELSFSLPAACPDPEISEFLSCSGRLFELLLKLQQNVATGEQEPAEVSEIFRRLFCFGKYYADLNHA